MIIIIVIIIMIVMIIMIIKVAHLAPAPVPSNKAAPCRTGRNQGQSAVLLATYV